MLHNFKRFLYAANRKWYWKQYYESRKCNHTKISVMEGDIGALRWSRNANITI